MNLEVARPPCDEFEHSTPQKPGLGFSLFPCQSTQALMEASAQLHLTCDSAAFGAGWPSGSL